MNAVFLGDDFADAERALPALPPGWGALVVVYWLKHEHRIARANRPHLDGYLDIWEPWPVLHINGAAVPTSWSAWWYPLPVGKHDVEVTTPVKAQQRVDITEGGRPLLVYQADVSERRSMAGVGTGHHGEVLPVQLTYAQGELLEHHEHATFTLTNR